MGLTGRVLAVLACLAAQGGGAAPPPGVAGDALGKALYRDGALASGASLRATLQKGVSLSGSDAACVKCHRRSGLGGGEGQNAIRPITGRYLFSPPELDRWARNGASGAQPMTRPVYTRPSLARVLREGVDPAGRSLDPLMPRYALSDEEVAGLHDYLGTLSSAAAPGVTDREIHFSTIVAPGVDQAKVRAMLEVLQAFFGDKNGGTRKETRRREVGSERMYRVYKTWVLHTWQLTGAPETWGGQLEEHYRRQPVFAVIGGIGGGGWRPVHVFCEERELPCVFPDVDHPEVSGSGHYSLYFSRGVTLEGELLAGQLAAGREADGPGRIVQVFRDDAAGRKAARDFRDALGRRGGGSVADRPVAAGGAAPREFWANLLDEARPNTLVVWLDAAAAGNLGRLGEAPADLKAVYLSASLSAMRPGNLSESWLDKVRMVYPFDLPEGRKRQLARLKAWLRLRNVAFSDERVQANAYFAATVAGDALYHMGDNFSRDYFIERIEQMAGSTLFSSIYPHLSLGPGQRFASRGGYVVRFRAGEDAAPVPVSDWMIP
jgi:hypothetical protein